MASVFGHGFGVIEMTKWWVWLGPTIYLFGRE